MSTTKKVKDTKAIPEEDSKEIEKYLPWFFRFMDLDVTFNFIGVIAFRLF